MSRQIRAVYCHRYAGLDEAGAPRATPEPLRKVLKLESIPAPDCQAESVLVQVHYAGVQYPDALQAQGLYQVKPPLPYVPGMDVSGTVLEVGAGVSHVVPGDRVIAQRTVPQAMVGSMAEQIISPADHVWKAPEGVPLAACANMSRNYFAAYYPLKILGEVKAGDLVLIDGASGGVGMAAIELAKAMGAVVIAGVSTPDKQAAPESAGADRVLCYGRDRDSYKAFKGAVRQASAELGHPEGVDVVVDMVQGDLFEGALLSAIRPMGRICLVGFTAGQKPIRPGLILIKQAVIMGSTWVPWARSNPEDHQQNVTEILGWLASGVIKPRADRIFPLANYIEAFELYENNQGRGNTVVCFQED
ncbi:MAG: NADPH:quinone oxidoreductase family protein [Candidatus Rariloculaceae bacterium]